MHWLDQRLAEISKSATDPIVSEAVEKIGMTGKALIDYFFDQAKGVDIKASLSIESHQVLDAIPNK